MLEGIPIKDKIIISALKNINVDGWTKESIISGFGQIK